MSVGYPEHFVAWMAINRARVVTRFRQATRAVMIEDDGHKITAHFLVEADPQLNSQSPFDERIRGAKNRLHEEALARIELMRRLFPDRESYACQGYGHKWCPSELCDDSTRKIGIARHHLPPIWFASVVSTYRGLEEQEFRPRNWHEYAQAVMELRISITLILRRLVDGLERYFLSRKLVQLIGNVVDMDTWDDCAHRLEHWPLLPACAVDEWGLLDELSKEVVQGQKALIRKQELAIQLYQAFLDTFQGFTFDLGTFLRQSVDVMKLNPVLGRTVKDAATRAMELAKAEQAGTREKTFGLSTLKLAATVKALSQLQSEFRHLVGQFVATEELNRLERQEEKLYQRAWDLWYLFETHPEYNAQNKRELGVQVFNMLCELRLAFNRECRKYSNANVKLERISESLMWEQEPALWVTIDGQDAVMTYNAVEKVVIALREAIRKMPDISLRRYVLDFHWPSAVVIPLVRGKSLFGTAWRWDLPTLLTGDELKWWQFWEYPVPSEAMAALRIATWEHPGFEPARKLLGNTQVLSLIAAHMGDFDNLPALDDDGVAQMQDYLHRVAGQASEVFQAVLDAESDMCRIFNSLSTDRRESRSHLVTAMKALIELHAIVLPSDQFSDKIAMGTSEVAKWAERLKKAREIAFFVYLSWASDVIDTIGEELKP